MPKQTTSQNSSRATSTSPQRHPHSSFVEAIIASAMDAIITIDEEQHIVAFNPAAEAMFGIESAAVLGQSIDQFVPPKFRAGHDRKITQFTDTGDTDRRMGQLGAVSAVRINGTEFPVEASISQATVNGQQYCTVILRDISLRVQAEDARDLLTREVDHRSRNILAVTQSLVSLTEGDTVADYVAALTQRLDALARAHSLLSQQRWKGAGLTQLVHDELSAHAEPEQFRYAGPEMLLASRTVQPVGMFIHELATNALKYGALSKPQGKVSVHWSLWDDGGIEFIWTERGGPPVTKPERAGFGTTLIQQIIENQLEGSFNLDWSPTGIVFRAILPARVIQSDTAETYPLDDQADRPEPQRSGRSGSGSGLDTPQRASEKTGNGTILIVEDEPLLAMQVSEALSAQGWTILGPAGSVESAQRILAGTQRPDAAILDIDLGGEPVFPIAYALRRAGIPFLFCTGFEDLANSEEFRDCVAIHKPATALQIIQGLREAVEQAYPTGSESVTD